MSETISNATCHPCQHCDQWTNFADSPHYQELVKRANDSWAWGFVNDICDKAGIPTHEPTTGDAIARSMLPQKRLELLAAELARAREIIDKLKKTADGVPIVPGMRLYAEKHKAWGGGIGSYVVASLQTTSTSDLDWIDGRLYSTEAATLAAKEADDE